VGGHCGEISAIEGGPRSANVIADRPSDALALNGRYLVAAIERNPKAAMTLIRIMAEHIRQAVTNIEVLGLHSAETRIWCRLMDLSRRYPGLDPKDTSVRIEHGLAQQSLADSVGLTRAMVNRQLNIWRDQGLIDYTRGVIVIPDPAAFEAFVWRDPSPM
jgi:CRP/FNR family cyclic AMP-dependent transcriptional regulator